LTGPFGEPDPIPPKVTKPKPEEQLTEPEAKPGDLNQDGKVDVNEFEILKTIFKEENANDGSKIGQLVRIIGAIAFIDKKTLVLLPNTWLKLTYLIFGTIKFLSVLLMVDRWITGGQTWLSILGALWGA
jgi:hypothetical protein